MPSTQHIGFRFAEFEMRPEALELRRNGTRLRLQVQPFRVLQLLLERAGEVVARDEFRVRIWPSNVYVDFDHGLNNAIAKLREVLGDSADKPCYIETLHRVGYRFIHPVEPIDAPAAVTPAFAAQPPLPAAADTDLQATEQPHDPAPPAAARTWRSPRWLAVGAALLAFAVLGILTVIDQGGGDAGDMPIRSIAVLSFKSLSEEGELDYFAAGMTEALITRLAQNQSLRVVSHRAAARHGDAEKSITKIAAELQVDAVIEGSIIRRGNIVRVDVQLVRAADESYAWAQSYQRSMQDVFLLQRELADGISSEIKATIDGKLDGMASVAQSDSIEAYELYLQGRHLLKQRNRQSASKALDYFQSAKDLDPEFAAAHAGVARAYTSLGGQTLAKSMSAEEVRPAAIAAARRAVELDAGLADAHLALASVLRHLFPRSANTDLEIEREYLLVLRLDPASADARHGYASFLSLLSRSSEAIVQYREALRLDPLSPNFMGRLGAELAANGKVEEGMMLMRRAVEIEPWQFNAHIRLGWAYAAFEHYEEANKAFARAEQISPASLQALAGRSYVAARTGELAEANAALEELQAQAEAIDAPFLVAIVHVGLQQDKDVALEWLERAAIPRNVRFIGGLYWLNHPVYDWLRGDPRFERIRQHLEGAEPGPDS